MRHMYNRDGMIPYVGKTRASKPWRSSRSRGYGIARKPSNYDPTIAVELEYTREDHKRRIAEILSQSKWSQPSGY